MITVQKNRPVSTEGYDHVSKLLLPGKTGEVGSISFLSVNNGWLCDKSTEVKVVLHENTESFKKSTTFDLKEEIWFGEYVAFESTVHPGYYLSHKGIRLTLERFVDTSDSKRNSSWKIKERGRYDSLSNWANRAFVNWNFQLDVGSFTVKFCCSFRISN